MIQHIYENIHQSVILVSFTWNKLFMNIKKKLDDDFGKPKPRGEMSKLEDYLNK